MNLKTRPSRFCGNSKGLRRSGVLVAAVLVFLFQAETRGWIQAAGSQTPAGQAEPVSRSGSGQSSSSRSQETEAPSDSQPGVLDRWQGLPVRRISFEGVTATQLDPLSGHLDQVEGAPLNPDAVRKSLRQLFATGLYETIEVSAAPLGDGVALSFQG